MKVKNFNDALKFSIEYNASISPQTSSKSNITKKFLIIFFTILGGAIYFWFYQFAFFFVLTVNIIFTINFTFKILLFCVSFFIKKHQKIEKFEGDLPIYTILLPCFMEKKETLKALIESISNLNYPKEKLDVKFLLEAEDSQTINILKNLKHNFEVLKVPYKLPQTKPKACNFGLFYAKGEFLVVYDAEDRPNPNQLLEALFIFKANKSKLACVQCYLNFYNSQVNILSLCFSLEYLTWFNCFLPSVAKLGFFIPLGGTSNHFRTKCLFEIGGWDAYNVTEDAELGIRLIKNGYKTEILHNFTLEEAPFKLEDWFFQRQRWMKGYLQTFLIHLLDFKGNFKAGIKQTLGIFLLIGFSFFSFFLLPFVMFFSLFVDLQNTIISSFLIFNIIAIVFYILIFFAIAKKEKFTNYHGVEFLMPIYFLLHVCASFVAMYQFFRNTFYWNKTRHSVKIEGSSVAR